MENNEKQVEEKVPMGMLNMMLSQNAATIKTLEQANERFYRIVKLLLAAIVIVIGGFLYYLSTYEVNVTTYGDFENSKVNAKSGIFEQHAQSITNGGEFNEDQK